MLKIKILILLFGTFFLTGCFEVIEELTYKDAESGTYLMTVNCSQSKTRLKALMKLDTFMGMKIPNTYEISRRFELARMAVSKVKGISKVHYATDFDNFIFTFTFVFDKTETLNKALHAAAASTTEKTIPYYKVYSYSGNTFERYQVPNDSIVQTLQHKKEQLKLISGAKATCIYRFHKPVGKVDNPKARISKNKKAVMLQQDITDIMSNPALFTNTITF